MFYSNMDLHIPSTCIFSLCSRTGCTQVDVFFIFCSYIITKKYYKHLKVLNKDCLMILNKTKLYFLYIQLISLN